MSAIAAEQAVRINLEATCLEPDCADLAWRFKRQLDGPKYSRGAAVMPVPASIGEWRDAHRTARKRTDRALRLGYTFAEVDLSRFNDDRHEINTSLATRQGRPMSAGYLERRDHGPLPAYACDRHRIHTYGVTEDATGQLRAYLTLYRCGDLALVSMILGHGDHLRNDIMYLLAAGTIREQAGNGGTLFYNRWDSGTDGLRYFKGKLGLAEADLEFAL